jgi:hypothetical protein
MSSTPEEQAVIEQFARLYPLGQTAVMRKIERAVCGCEYGGTSWTTRPEAQEIGRLLALDPSLRLLDLGAGSGWPSLYLATMTGCDVVLVDVPLAGLRIAAERAVETIALKRQGSAVGRDDAAPAGETISGGYQSFRRTMLPPCEICRPAGLPASDPDGRTDGFHRHIDCPRSCGRRP